MNIPVDAGQLPVRVPITPAQMRSALWLRCVPWLRNGALAITDQALISASNFLVSILLARWLDIRQYGAYALAFSGYLFLLACSQALIIEPLCVFGAAEFREEFRRYLGALIRFQALISGFAVILFGAAAMTCALFPRLHWATTAIVGLTIASPLLLAFTLMRAATYIVLSPSTAVRAALLYCIVVLVSLGGMSVFHILSAASSFLVMGLASAIVSVWLAFRLKPIWFSEGFSVRHLAEKHWSFGRWEMAKVGSEWVCENISYVIAGAVLGIAEAGTMKALVTLFLPLSQALTALKRLFLPFLARKFSHEGDDATRDSVKSLAILYTSGTAVYALAVILAAPRLVPILYGNKFPAVIGLIPWFAVVLTVGVPVYALDMGLRAVRLPKAIFFSSVAAAASQILVAWPLTKIFGLRGLIVANLVSGVLFMAIMIRSIRQSGTLAVSQDSSVT